MSLAPKPRALATMTHPDNADFDDSGEPLDLAVAGLKISPTDEASADAHEDILDLDTQSVIEDAPLELTGYERRVSVRAYNYWASLLGNRNFPSVHDLQAEAIESFRDHSILLDFSQGPQNAVLRYIGKGLRDECGLGVSDIKPDDVPGKSLLSRLTDHYLEIIANRAPIGFEAEFNNAKGHPLMYRGILLPLSDDDDNINFIYGVLSWKEEVSTATVVASFPEQARTAWDKATALATETETQAPADESVEDAFDTLELTETEYHPAPQKTVDTIQDNEALLVLLDHAKAAAEQVRSSDGRTRAALYDALTQAYAFHGAATAEPEQFQALLAHHDLVQQPRAPYTPTVKLIFGTDYDKTRLTEYAAALGYAEREEISSLAFRGWLDGFEGGLKGVVAAERDARAKAKGNSRLDKASVVRVRLASRPAMATITLPDDVTGDYVLLVARRQPGSQTADIVAVAPTDAQLVDTVLRRLNKH